MSRAGYEVKNISKNVYRMEYRMQNKQTVRSNTSLHTLWDLLTAYNQQTAIYDNLVSYNIFKDKNDINNTRTIKNFIVVVTMDIAGKTIFGIYICRINPVFVVMLFGYVIHWLPDALKIKYRDWFVNTPVYMKIIICGVVVFIIYQSLSAELQPFIYFQF